MPPEPFSAADFRARAARLAAQEADDGEHLMNPDLRDEIFAVGLREAAVLVPVVDRGADSAFLLTERTATLRAHSGQIAFPGGRIDPGETPEAAALRETEEEIGLGRDRVELVGRMPPYVTGSGYRIAPVLGVVFPPFELRLNPAEVESAFEVPLRFLMDPANHRYESRIWKERERFFYSMPFAERRIWGITAGILRRLYERMYQ